MKKLLLLFILLPVMLVAEEKKELNIYYSWIVYYPDNMEDFSDSYEVRGVMYNYNDSTVTLAYSMDTEDYLTKSYTTETYNIENIKHISFRKKNRFKYWVIGATVTSLAISTGLLLTPDNSDDDNPYGPIVKAFLAANISFSGIILGSIVGSQKHKYKINFNKQEFDKHRQTFEQYAIEKQLKNKELLQKQD